MAVTTTPQYDVLVEVQDNLEDLRDRAFAAAHDNPFTSTEHWDEKRPSEVAFCFTTWKAAFLFTMLAEELRRCIGHCMETDALQPHPAYDAPDYASIPAWRPARSRPVRLSRLPTTP
jgi:hypothetical protein